MKLRGASAYCTCTDSFFRELQQDRAAEPELLEERSDRSRQGRLEARAVELRMLKLLIACDQDIGCRAAQGREVGCPCQNSIKRQRAKKTRSEL
jgi:hypothetical protein